MKTNDFNFYLPEKLIAQKPCEKRDFSKLMVINKQSEEIRHKHFYDIIDYLDKGDTLVLNNTRVIPARLFGKKSETGAIIEILLLKRVKDDVWEILVKPGKKAKVGVEIEFGDNLNGIIRLVKDDGNRYIEFIYTGIFEEILDELGMMPLPPYITEKLDDKERYQTVYSKIEGSAAAPTAGLHFTDELLDKMKNKGINITYITLHVGLGTFRPVKVDDIANHKMHKEYFVISKETADTINETKKNGNKVIAVGTTTVRTLESVASEEGFIQESSGWTDIFIYPGYRFKVIDKLITNFHLPKSTLIMLVAAFSERELIMKGYEMAVKEGYRFFSFGDSMLITN